MLSALLPMAAQNNPYEIDDICYECLQRAEQTVDDLSTDDFEHANARLLEQSIVRHDEKARTLYYVFALRRLCRQGEVAAPEQRKQVNASVDAAFDKLLEVSRETGLTQYYYYSYDLAQNYYFNTRQVSRAFSLLDRMLKDSERENDEYGQWQALRFLAQIYQQQADFVNTRRYLTQCLELYHTTKDPTILRQPVTRIYCDLADTYDYQDDTCRLYYKLAMQAAQAHLDTLRCAYYQAQLAAFDKVIPEYEAKRDFCLKDPAFRSFFRTGPEMFLCVDAIVRDELPEQALLDTLALARQQLFIGRLAAQWEQPDLSLYMMRKRYEDVQSILSHINDLHLEEAAGQYETFRLSRELHEKKEEVALATRLVAVMLVIMLIGALAFSLVHIRILRRQRKADVVRIRELKEANDRVQMANAAKTRFVQNMSHEVRTPLNAIVGFSQLLTLPDGSFSEAEKAEFSEHVVNNTQMLTMLLDDILNTSAIDSGNYRITYAQGEMHYIARAALTSAEHRLKPGVKMYYEPESEEPFTFTTDPRRVQQILINLLTNACKHTKEGQICLSSSLTKRPGYVHYAVTDSGPGIPPDQAEKIFERFTKLNNFVQGTGLGLSICRDVAIRMGAEVYLDTGYTAGGARFILDVPTEPEGKEPIKTV